MPQDTSSRLLETAQAYRDALEANTSGAVDDITRGWASAAQRVDVEVQSLLAKMEAARLAGVEPSPAWLYQQRRLAALADTIQAEVERWAPMAEAHTRELAYQAARDATTQAQTLAREAADVSLPGLEAVFTDLNPENMATILGHLAPGGPLRDLMVSLGGETAEAATQALLQGTLLGKGTDWIARELKTALDIPRWRAETIARTEALRSYRETSRETFKRSNVVGSWVWTSALDRRTCPACMALHGEEFSLDETLDGHPRCRCAMVPRTPSWGDIDPSLADLPDTRPPIETGADWFGRQTPATQRAVLGPGKYDRWAKGEMELGDVVARTHSPAWGTMRRERSMREMDEGRNANFRDAPTEVTEDDIWADLIAQDEARATAGPDWDRWERDRDRRVGRSASPEERARLTSDRDNAQRWADEDTESVALWDRRVKERQAELRQAVPDAKERTKVARTDGTLKRAKEQAAEARRQADASADRLRQAQQKLDDATPDDAPDWDPDNPLAGYGDRLTIYDRSTSTAKHLQELEDHVPLSHHQALRDWWAGTDRGGFYIGDRYITDLDDLGHLKGQRPRGWAEGSDFDQVPGVYDPTRRVCACGGDGKGHGSTSLVLHEGGHGLDDALGHAHGAARASDAPDFVDAYGSVPQALKDRWNPYYTGRGNPEGFRSEAWAEGYAGHAKARHLTDRQRADAVATAMEGRARPRTPEELDAYMGLVRYFDGLQ